MASRRPHGLCAALSHPWVVVGPLPAYRGRMRQLRDDAVHKQGDGNSDTWASRYGQHATRTRTQNPWVVAIPWPSRGHCRCRSRRRGRNKRSCFESRKKMFVVSKRARAQTRGKENDGKMFVVRERTTRVVSLARSHPNQIQTPSNNKIEPQPEFIIIFYNNNKFLSLF